MEYDKNICPVVNVDGVIERGKQYDLDITLPEDNRNVIYGIVRDCYKDPVKDAVVKLIEVECKMGKDIRKPVSHTFTDDNGEFVFGPLCANRLYEVEIWVFPNIAPNSSRCCNNTNFMNILILRYVFCCWLYNSNNRNIVQLFYNV